MDAARDQTILVVDDEEQIRRALNDALHPLGIAVLEADTGAGALAIVTISRPDLVVLDLGLPDMHGDAVCAAIRERSSVPIIVLSARHAEDEKVALFTAGADDYVTKPFSLAEFVARVRAQLRRAGTTPYSLSSLVECDGLSIDLERHEIVRDARALRLTRTEWKLLETLLVHAGRTLTHQQLFDAVWAKSYGHPQQYLRVHVTNLRRKIEREPASPRLIVTEPGVGYRFEREPS
ncbi:MAG TPA: response regulator transcription factor [Gemmatimonadaceae bacterium]|jgi:two-component system KDP operon response regulator KdpE|nr:response regulator transcription factor [Gemmatimonadaceae bacterium]